MRTPILGVPIDNLSRNQILVKIKEFLQNKGQNLITTPNPEILVDSEQDWFFKEIFYRSSLNIADGFGLILASLFLYGKKISRFPGSDLMLGICKIAQMENKSIYLLGASKKVVEETAKKLVKLYPHLRIAGANPGLKIEFSQNDKNKRIWHNEFLTGLSFNRKENQKIINDINQVKPDLLFVAFGHLKQEKWLVSFLSQMPSVKIAVGVGGAFDYISGVALRAPKLARVIGLEWLWRLFTNPRYRTQRVFKATIIFLRLIWEYKKILKKKFRRGVAGFIVNNSGQFFIAKRTPEHFDFYSLYTEQWQPPQGGVEPGESLERAVIREIEEETGFKTSVLCEAKKPYFYERTTNSAKKSRFKKYRGVEKYIFLLKYDGDGLEINLDKQELCDYKWVSLEELKRIIHPLRRRSLEILLEDCSCRLPAQIK
ncbi:MAG: Teichoic acid biosynthesis protein [Candidatus Magasanikbacteria bacterium GW2011_GWC2_40_17]|uniref:Teichoic acid biosynthesis protein n=1 Tax=Candidatus Magasanikbacteria bacterium GW2011_GWA2_42_32 TaxID=1619039 RepID=A0A0G1A924_9BACT|nr:MAG: Teichoic acid biosynthesis protein [Candidatus Magasanikbacteria bacterium GW2011_GWC2_40_17]KKS57530.1 MAG: Teichoic acid biosynthesis protein [Candidatus Magasanikbacteria bacterium GW2011_GWA2_42_32]OGH85245.1 MAG: hypothetical protein A2294_00675 [Candidatus Magasanikbacteria bacterium RIFOXYB2_FULL_38_10]